MKAILFATTALVATAGIAAAEVSLTGSAEMGIMGGDGIADQFHTDIDVTFGMSGEADNGLSFGASVDLDESIGDAAEQGGDESQATRDDAEHGGATMFVAYGGAKLTMGDTDGAFDKVLNEAIIGSSLGDNHEHGGYNGNSGLDGTYDGQIARFDYSFDAFTGALSVEVDDSGDSDPVWGLGVAYNAELAGLDLGVGLGYQTTDDDNDADEIWGLSLDTTFANGIQAIVNYSSKSFVDAEDEEHWGIAFGYSMQALTVAVNYGEYDNVDGVDGDTAKGWGLIANYDLGGGIEAQFGYGDSESETGGVEEDDNTYSLGLAMSF
ncbi:outer membrane protein OmpU [Primorskyibacter sedentarius]|uniref:Outer membrane protein OmpU n=1 Tax=Primorskyibacter sedentarius TaxID=745311 RepID=A0A4R3JKC3_9RHOB|nr:porin [Primorskyibacter sedentarius]TCS65360.1 outer membrane protein OmpU [Primorskyibacter sedentarius]